MWQWGKLVNKTNPPGNKTKQTHLVLSLVLSLGLTQGALLGQSRIEDLTLGCAVALSACTELSRQGGVGGERNASFSVR